MTKKSGNSRSSRNSGNNGKQTIIGSCRLLLGVAAVLAMGTGAGAVKAGAIIYGLQFAPANYTAYTGWAPGVTVATFTPPTFFSVNTTSYTLGTATFAITGNNYNIQNGIANGTPTADIQWLNHAFFFGNGTTPLTATLSGLSAADTVDLQFIESYQTQNEPQVTVAPAGSNSQPTAISTDTTFTDAGTYTGATSYALTFANANGGAGEFDLSGALITITSGSVAAVPQPATLGLLGVGGLGFLMLGLLARRRLAV